MSGEVSIFDVRWQNENGWEWDVQARAVDQSNVSGDLMFVVLELDDHQMRSDAKRYRVSKYRHNNTNLAHKTDFADVYYNSLEEARKYAKGQAVAEAMTKDIPV